MSNIFSWAHGESSSYRKPSSRQKGSPNPTKRSNETESTDAVPSGLAALRRLSAKANAQAETQKTADLEAQERRGASRSDGAGWRRREDQSIGMREGTDREEIPVSEGQKPFAKDVRVRRLEAKDVRRLEVNRGATQFGLQGYGVVAPNIDEDVRQYEVRHGTNDRRQQEYGGFAPIIDEDRQELLRVEAEAAEWHDLENMEQQELQIELALASENQAVDHIAAVLATVYRQNNGLEEELSSCLAEQRMLKPDLYAEQSVLYELEQDFDAKSVYLQGEAQFLKDRIKDEEDLAQRRSQLEQAQDAQGIQAFEAEHEDILSEEVRTQRIDIAALEVRLHEEETSTQSVRASVEEEHGMEVSTLAKELASVEAHILEAESRSNMEVEERKMRIKADEEVLQYEVWAQEAQIQSECQELRSQTSEEATLRNIVDVVFQEFIQSQDEGRAQRQRLLASHEDQERLLVQQGDVYRSSIDTVEAEEAAEARRISECRQAELVGLRVFVSNLDQEVLQLEGAVLNSGEQYQEKVAAVQREHAAATGRKLHAVERHCETIVSQIAVERQKRERANQEKMDSLHRESIADGRKRSQKLAELRSSIAMNEELNRAECQAIESAIETSWRDHRRSLFVAEDAGERAFEKVRIHYEAAMAQLLEISEDEAVCQEARYEAAAVELETVELQRKQESRTAECTDVLLGQTSPQNMLESTPDDVDRVNVMNGVYNSWHGELCAAEISCLRAHVHGLEASQEKETGTVRRMAAQQEDHLANQISYLQEDRGHAVQKYETLEEEVNMMRSEVQDFRSVAHRWREAHQEKTEALMKQSVEWKAKASELEEALKSAQFNAQNKTIDIVSIYSRAQEGGGSASAAQTGMAQNVVGSAAAAQSGVQRRMRIPEVQTLHTATARTIGDLTPGTEAYIRDLEERVKEAEQKKSPSPDRARRQHRGGGLQATPFHGRYHADPQPSADPPVRHARAA